MKKIDWQKIWNPSNIDFEAMQKMNDQELEAYTNEIYVGMFAMLWVRFAYMVNYLQVSNIWQYGVALFLSR